MHFLNLSFKGTTNKCLMFHLECNFAIILKHRQLKFSNLFPFKSYYHLNNNADAEIGLTITS